MSVITEKKPLIIQIPGERTPNELPVSASAVGYDFVQGNYIYYATGSDSWVTAPPNGADNQRITIATSLTTISTGSVMTGQFYWDTSDWSNSPTGVTIRAIGNVTSPPHTASMRVYNLTSNSFVNLVGATAFLNITASNSTFVTSSNILANLTSGNSYELRISSSLSSSAVVLGNAELYVTF